MGNFNIEPYWVEGLPTASGKFGQDNKFLYHYSVAVRQKGFTNESLFWLYVDKFVLNTYPNDPRTIKQDYRTGYILKGTFLSNLTVVLEGCKSQDRTMISGGKCGSAGLSSYLVFQIQHR